MTLISSFVSQWFTKWRQREAYNEMPVHTYSNQVGKTSHARMCRSKGVEKCQMVPECAKRCGNDKISPRLGPCRLDSQSGTACSQIAQISKHTIHTDSTRGPGASIMRTVSERAPEKKSERHIKQLAASQLGACYVHNKCTWMA